MTSSPRSQFTLQGTSISLDARVHAVRGDLADLALAGQLFVPHYARAMPMRCNAVRTAIMDGTKPESKMTSELLLGEDFMALEISGGWAWGYCGHDHYVGYVEAAHLNSAVDLSTHVITVREAAVRPSADDTTVSLVLPMGCKISGERNGDFIETVLGQVPMDAIDGHFEDAVSVAEELLETPYLWGGRSGAGIDCSGLVQLGYALANGMAAPRDSDQQQLQFGQDIPAGARLQRNDVIFFPGHVGLMANETDLIHATRYHNMVVREPLETVVARVARKNEITPDAAILARKRVS